MSLDEEESTSGKVNKITDIHHFDLISEKTKPSAMAGRIAYRVSRRQPGAEISGDFFVPCEPTGVCVCLFRLISRLIMSRSTNRPFMKSITQPLQPYQPAKAQTGHLKRTSAVPGKI